MQAARRFCAADSDLRHLGGQAPGGQRGDGGTQGLQCDGRDADACRRVFGKHRVQHGLHAAFRSADEHRVRGGQAVESFRRFAFDEGQVVRTEFLPVFADERTGVRLALHSVHAAFRGRKGQFHTHAAGACAHIPQGIGGGHRQFCQRGGTHLLLGHGYVAPGEGFIRPAL